MYRSINSIQSISTSAPHFFLEPVLFRDSIACSTALQSDRQQEYNDMGSVIYLLSIDMNEETFKKPIMNKELKQRKPILIQCFIDMDQWCQTIDFFLLLNRRSIDQHRFHTLIQLS